MRSRPPTPEGRIRRPVAGAVREVWPGEARDFTPWLAENMEYLDALGLDHLAAVEVEATLPDTWRSLDTGGQACLLVSSHTKE